MTEATCTSTDPTNHQGDTCPVHEQHDALVAALRLAYEALSGMGEQTEAAWAAAYDALKAAK